LLFLALPGAGCKKQANFAAHFGWGGYGHTDLEMAEFFDADHTAMARFMFQYPRGYIGPILSNSGTATKTVEPYMVGLGDFQKSNDGIGQPLLLMVGGKEARYTVSPPLAPERWYHVAVARSGCTFRLYLDGQLLPTDAGGDGITLAPGDCSRAAGPPRGNGAGGDPADVACDGSGDPGGVQGVDVCEETDPSIGLSPDQLRLGRAMNGYKYYRAQANGIQYYYIPQFYGFIDDVAVFDRALDEDEIESIAELFRLRGDEAGLLAGYTFDAYTPSGDPLPTALTRPVSFHTAVPGLIPAGRTQVSRVRDTVIDVPALPLPFHRVQLDLPFEEDLPYEVVQGYGGATSHNGYACFCYDFNRRDYKGQANQSYGQEVHASAPGTLMTDLSTTGDPNCSNHNAAFRYRVMPDEYTLYMHVVNPQPPPSSVQRGGLITELGKYECLESKSHLHFAGNSLSADTFPNLPAGQLVMNTIPVAFRDYLKAVEFDESGHPTVWEPVAVGVPRPGDWIKKPRRTMTLAASFVQFASGFDAACSAFTANVEMATDMGLARGSADMQARISGKADAAVVRDAGAQELLIDGLTLRLERPQSCLTLQFDNRTLPDLNVGVQGWTVHLRAEETLRGRMGADGLAVIPLAPMVLQADLVVNAGRLGSHDVGIEQLVDLQLAARFVEGAGGPSLDLAIRSTAAAEVPRADLPPGVEAIRLTLGLDAARVALAIPPRREPVLPGGSFFETEEPIYSEESGQVPGDCNQDGTLNISDAICAFGVLFLGNPARFPCGDGSPRHPGNLNLIDWQADGEINLSDGIGILSFLFGAGRPHPAAVPGSETSGCALMPECPLGPACR
jgi:hypothetical protein